MKIERPHGTILDSEGRVRVLFGNFETPQKYQTPDAWTPVTIEYVDGPAAHTRDKWHPSVNIEAPDTAAVGESVTVRFESETAELDLLPAETDIQISDLTETVQIDGSHEETIVPELSGTIEIVAEPTDSEIRGDTHTIEVTSE